MIAVIFPLGIRQAHIGKNQPLTPNKRHIFDFYDIIYRLLHDDNSLSV